MQIERERFNLYRQKLPHNPVLEELEKTYGKYLYLPLDIPRIQANDQEKFVHWYFQNSKKIRKLKADVAGPGVNYNPLFRTVDSVGLQNPVWQTNPLPELFKEFPELESQIMEFPFMMKPVFSLWSSIDKIAPHRDQGPWRDLPFAFRVMLYDDNPTPTLYLAEVKADEKIDKNNIVFIPRHEETNSFAWNNLRVKHGSKYDPAFSKILMIFLPQHINTNKLIDLYERSVSKYEHLTLKSKMDHLY